MKANKIDPSKLATNTYEKIAQIYATQYFDDLTDIPYIDKLLGKLQPGSRILDVGSGPGQFAKYMLHKGFSVDGVDFSKQMLAIARNKVPDVNFSFMDMRSLDFADHSFDGLLVAYSLIHIPSVEIPKTLTGFNRVLKPGGYIEIIAQKGKTDIIIDEPFMPSEKMFFNFFSKEKLKKFLEEAGFEIEYQREAKSPDPEVGSDTIIYTIAKKKLGYDLYLADQIDRNNLPSIDVEISKSREIS